MDVTVTSKMTQELALPYRLNQEQPPCFRPRQWENGTPETEGKKKRLNFCAHCDNYIC